MAKDDYNKRKAEDAPMPAKEHKKKAKKLRTKSRSAIDKALGKSKKKESNY